MSGPEHAIRLHHQNGETRKRILQMHIILKNDMCNWRTPPLTQLQTHTHEYSKKSTTLKMPHERFGKKETGERERTASRWLVNDRCFFFI